MERTREPAAINGKRLLGHKTTLTTCITATEARRPHQNMLIDGFAKDCRQKSASMENGKYESIMSSKSEGPHPDYKARFLGDYDRTSFDLHSFSTQEIDGPSGIGMAVLTAKLNGRHMGPCT